jgi:O-acetyl-ADP-ribose deacetylase (regulator of RNase III)
MITYIKGDLFAEDHPFIAYGVNCQGVMGSGVAKIIKEKYPWSYIAYKDFCELRDPEYLLGAVKSCWNSGPTKIIHCFTQLDYGKDGKRYVSYDAIDDCMQRMKYYSWKDTYIAMPKIGSGLGGGDWEIISTIIERNCKDIDIRIYEL